MPDVYTYDRFPQEFRVQVVHIWTDAFGRFDVYNTPAPGAYKVVRDALCREYGRFVLADERSAAEDLVSFLLNTSDPEELCDALQLSFRYIERICGTHEYRYKAQPAITPDEAVAELNHRFREHALGYHFQDGTLIRKDSEILHQEVVRPTLRLLQDPAFKGAEQEYTAAYEHYRHGRMKEAINDCLKALESSLKVALARARVPIPDRATAKSLLDAYFAAGVFPTYLQSEFTALRAVLESGVPVVRNRTSAHGQGSDIASVPGYVAAFILHTTGAAILFVASASDE
jgi:hypothetical protein